MSKVVIFRGRRYQAVVLGPKTIIGEFITLGVGGERGVSSLPPSNYAHACHNFMKKRYSNKWSWNQLDLYLAMYNNKHQVHIKIHSNWKYLEVPFRLPYSPRTARIGNKFQSWKAERNTSRVSSHVDATLC